jgi:hypothetical protein
MEHPEPLMLGRVQSPCALISVACIVLACRGSFFGHVRVLMIMAHATVWSRRLPREWIGTSPVGWSGHRPPLERQGAVNAEAAHRLSGSASYP